MTSERTPKSYEEWQAERRLAKQSAAPHDPQAQQKFAALEQQQLEEAQQRERG